MFIATMHRRLEVVQILAALGGRDLLMLRHKSGMSCTGIALACDNVLNTGAVSHAGHTYTMPEAAEIHFNCAGTGTEIMVNVLQEACQQLGLSAHAIEVLGKMPDLNSEPKAYRDSEEFNNSEVYTNMVDRMHRLQT